MIPTDFRFRRPLSLAIALAFAGSTAHAATITVGDASDAAVPTGCTLREAIMSINGGTATAVCNGAVAGTFGADDTIVFDTALVGSTITLSQGELDVAAPLTINGSEQTIDANALSRVLFVASPIVASPTLTISNLTFTGGSADYGAGIYAGLSTVTLNDMTISKNTASQAGGGIYANNCALILNNSTVSGNSAAGHGGGIGAYGGTTTVSNSTISENTTPNQGGGVYVISGSITLTNATVTGNSAAYGGGAYVSKSTGSFNNSTITGNSATSHGGGVTAYNNAAIGFANSIVSGNTTPGTNPNIDEVAATNYIEASTATSSFSLLGTELQVGFNNNGNLFNDDPGVFALGDNGGPTQTMALRDNSSAIDAGDNAFVPVGLQYDQRGVGHPRILTGTVDMGSFEYSPDEIFKNGFELPTPR